MLLAMLAVVAALTLAVLSAPRLLGSLSALSQASPAEAVLTFAAFVLPLVLLAVIAGIDTSRRSLRTFREARFPPRGMRVLRDTPVVEGRRARLLGAFGVALGVTLLLAAGALAATSYRIGRVLLYGCPRAAARPPA
jgi:hypothetical protein